MPCFVKRLVSILHGFSSRGRLVDMSLRGVLQKLLRTSRPALYCTMGLAQFIVNDTEAKKPDAEQKLKFEPPDKTKFTHEYMIQQSTIDAVNSASQALTVTYMAILATSDEYKNLLSQLISLSRDTLQFTVTDKHWDMIIELRSKVQTKKDLLNKLNGYVDYVYKMAQAASEISYLSGLENLSFTLAQRIDDALRNIKEEFHNITILEQEYCDVQEQCIRHEKESEPTEKFDE